VEKRGRGNFFTGGSTQSPKAPPCVIDQVLQAGVEGQRPTLLVQLNKEIFALPPGHIEVSLLPELVTLAEVAAEVVLVLHHILRD